ncbi:hypothetical protein PtrM4_103550 [Pyrenophora tritici-repentis]|nr:hypothetical protein PtrM4_103550 [Pyrenophora tritici-repentis]
MTGKLRTADDESIHLALMLVCKDIITEVNELFLKRNAVTVSTGGPEPAHTGAPEASRYEHASLQIRRTKALVLLLNASAVSFTVKQAMDLFPDTGKQLFRLLTGKRLCKRRRSCLARRSYWYGPMSGHSELLEILFQNAQSMSVLGSSEDVATYSKYHEYCMNEKHILTTLSTPWEIPPDAQFRAMDCVADEPLRVQPRYMRSYSPVARFGSVMQKISGAARNNIRTVILEDLYGSVASPECHSRGLIPLCKDHPQLRIERRANVQDAVLQGYYNRVRGQKRTRIVKALLIRVMTRWIEEAMTLELARMPPGAFELIFVGELKAIATTLKIVKEAAVWHLAFQRHFQDGIVRQANGCPNTGIDPVAAVLARHLPGILRGT